MDAVNPSIFLNQSKQRSSSAESLWLTINTEAHQLPVFKLLEQFLLLARESAGASLFLLLLARSVELSWLGDVPGIGTYGMVSVAIRRGMSFNKEDPF